MKKNYNKHHKLKLRIAEKDLHRCKENGSFVSLKDFVRILTTNAINYSSDGSEIEVNVRLS